MNALVPKKAVEITDDFTAEFEAAVTFANGFYAKGRHTLISSISAGELAAWDGSDEAALVSDPDGVELSDEELEDKAA